MGARPSIRGWAGPLTSTPGKPSSPGITGHHRNGSSPSEDPAAAHLPRSAGLFVPHRDQRVGGAEASASRWTRRMNSHRSAEAFAGGPGAVVRGVPEPVPEPVPESVPKPVPESVPKPVPESVPKPVPEPVPAGVAPATAPLRASSCSASSPVSGRALLAGWHLGQEATRFHIPLRSGLARGSKSAPSSRNTHGNPALRSPGGRRRGRRCCVVRRGRVCCGPRPQRPDLAGPGCHWCRTTPPKP
jgi:hypothetical protein